MPLIKSVNDALLWQAITMLLKLPALLFLNQSVMIRRASSMIGFLFALGLFIDFCKHLLTLIC